VWREGGYERDFGPLQVLNFKKKKLLRARGEGRRRRLLVTGWPVGRLVYKRFIKV
jgi:hypothetical protein